MRGLVAGDDGGDGAADGGEADDLVEQSAGVADPTTAVVVARQLLDEEEAEEVALFVGGVEQRRHGLDGTGDPSDARGARSASCRRAWTKRAPRSGGAAPAEHLHDGGRRDDAAQCVVP